MATEPMRGPVTVSASVYSQNAGPLPYGYRRENWQFLTTRKDFRVREID